AAQLRHADRLAAPDRIQPFVAGGRGQLDVGDQDRVAGPEGLRPGGVGGVEQVEVARRADVEHGQIAGPVADDLDADAVAGPQHHAVEVVRHAPQVAQG